MTISRLHDSQKRIITENIRGRTYGNAMTVKGLIKEMEMELGKLSQEEEKTVSRGGADDEDDDDIMRRLEAEMANPKSLTPRGSLLGRGSFG